MTRIAFIGLGNIGFPMAQNLLRAGFDLAVHDLRRDRADQLIEQGGRWAATPAAAMAGADVVITSLPTPVAVRSVFEARDGLLAGAVAGQAWIEMSTTDVGQLKELAAVLSERGVDVLEAPVTGGVDNAYKAAITVFAGGDATVFEHHRHILDALAARVIYLGPLGGAMVVKLITNMICFSHAAALSEGLLLGTRAGISAAPLLEAIRQSYAGSFVADVDGPRAIAGTYDSAWTLDLALKDQRLSHALAAEFAVPLAFGGLATAALERARARYGGDADCLMMMKAIIEDADPTGAAAQASPH